jgi:hypothetical protein
MAMLLVLCPVTDLDALWFVEQARRAHIPCTVVTTDLLSFPRRRSHRIDARGIDTIIELADGTSLDRPAGVLNRMVDPPDVAWRRAAPAERNYAAAELHAFTLAWLWGLDGPVRNRPDPACLAGPLPSPVVVAHAAARAGLACGALRIGTDDSDDLLTAAVRASIGPLRPVHLPVLDGEVETSVDVPGAVREGIRTLVKDLAVHEALIGLDFLIDGSTWRLAGLTPVAGLRAGGEMLAHRLCALLHEGGLRS